MMGRNRLPEDEKRKLINLKLPPNLIKSIKEIGRITQVIEKAIIEYINRHNNT
jgi:hypothetical protein